VSRARPCGATSDDAAFDLAVDLVAEGPGEAGEAILPCPHGELEGHALAVLLQGEGALLVRAPSGGPDRAVAGVDAAALAGQVLEGDAHLTGLAADVLARGAQRWGEEAQGLVVPGLGGAVGSLAAFVVVVMKEAEVVLAAAFDVDAPAMDAAGVPVDVAAGVPGLRRRAA